MYRSLNNESVQRQINYAGARNITVLPVTEGDGTPCYGVYHCGRLLCRCLLLQDAAELAVSLAYYHQGI